MPNPVNNQVQRFFNELLETLSIALEQKDPYYGHHSLQVATGCAEFAAFINLPPSEQVDKIYFAGLLHDLGMIYVPSIVLNKKGRLTEKEMRLVRKHPARTESLLKPISIFREILPVIRQHHENMDGSGYPAGLSGDEISTGARILALVDSYDALTTSRPYRKARTPQKALELIVSEVDKRYDPILAAAFVKFHLSRDPKLKNPFDAVGDNKGPAGKTLTPKEEIREAIKKITAKFNRGDIELPVLPQVVGEVDTVINKPTSSAEDLAKVIEKDAAISLQLISVANSPYYRGVEPISTVRAAIPRLGYRETQNIVSAIACRNIYRVKHPKFKQLMENVWLHSLATGFAARGVARRLHLTDDEQFFFLGVVHDIGKVVLIRALAETVKKRSQVHMPELRNGIMTAHGDLSGSLMKRWRLPAEYAKAVGRHERGGFGPDSDKSLLLLSLADSLAASVGYRVFDQDPLVRLSELDTPGLLNLDVDSLGNLAKEVRKFMGEAARFF
jgi:HD-GYP domain-containing protein (c-di-GMP phosphodiesterase class II)